ncbi:cytochrome P450, partial [Dendrothele bispora CBS 962.96]
LPPGPKGVPFLGNISYALGIQKASHQWAYYAELSKKYCSDIVHFGIIGEHVIVLNSVKATNEILEKRSGLYSDRARTFVRSAARHHHVYLTNSPYRLHRRTFHQDFNRQAIATYEPIMLDSCSALLKKLAPEQYDLTHAGFAILNAVYGMTTQGEIDDYVHLAGLAAPSVVETFNHGSFLVDFFPLLKYVPAWLPGGSFKKKAAAWAPTVSNLRNAPNCVATKNFEKFNVSPTLQDGLHTNIGSEANMEEVIKNTTGIAYFELPFHFQTVALLMSSLLVLSHHPEVQKKAQKELDSVIGRHRLPDFSDQKSLPYIDAILKEVQRMYPVTPLRAVPHRSTSNDIYDGYFIPKGSVIIGNAWAILHDPKVYFDPLRFNPDRFMEKDSNMPPNPELYAFGFGRRVCPGRHFALQAAWIVLASVLATCNIMRSRDDDLRKKIDPWKDFNDGVIVHPKPFKCRIVPRSLDALNLMN